MPSWIRVVATNAGLVFGGALLGALVNAGVFGLFALLTALREGFPYDGRALVAAPAVLQFLSRGRSRRRARRGDRPSQDHGPPQCQRVTSDCGVLVFWTGRKRLEPLGRMEKRK